MSATSLARETYLPDDDSDVAPVYDFLTAHEAAGRGRAEPRYFLSGSDAGGRVELPVEVYRVLRQVVEALRQGLAMTAAPQTTTHTTQQAAELLGVSRPTVIKLLDENKVPFERVGSHRRILLRDLLAYRMRRRAEQYAMLEATAAAIGEDEDVEGTLNRLREARRTVARRRRGTTEH